MLPQRSEEQHQCPLILPVCCLRSEAPLAFPSIWSAHLATSCSSARVSWIFALSLQCIPGLICVQCSRVVGYTEVISKRRCWKFEQHSGLEMWIVHSIQASGALATVP